MTDHMTFVLSQVINRIEWERERSDLVLPCSPSAQRSVITVVCTSQGTFYDSLTA